MKKLIAVYVIACVIFAWVAVVSVNSCVDYVKTVGLKNIVNEIWEGK